MKNVFITIQHRQIADILLQTRYLQALGFTKVGNLGLVFWSDGLAIGTKKLYLQKFRIPSNNTIVQLLNDKAK